jgi:radical SAM protein with 4Fe4S-binding SPASM domain
VSLSISTEPTLHRRLGELLRITKSYKVPFVYMHTNGTLLSERLIEQIVRSGMDQVSISIDGATKETYERIRVGARFERLIENMRALNQAKERLRSDTPHIHFNVVLMRSNIEELPGLIRLARDLRIRGISAMHLVPFSIAAVDSKKESLEGHKELCNQIFDESRTVAEKCGVGLSLPEPFTLGPPDNDLIQIQTGHRVLSFLPPGQEEGTRSRCPFPWHFVGLRENGDIQPCVWWFNEPVMGNLLTEPFAQIWNNEAYRRLRAEHTSGELRRGCRTCSVEGRGDVNSESAFALK